MRACARDSSRLEAKLRRRDLLAADDALVDFYLERIPADVATHARLRALVARRGAAAPARGSTCRPRCCSRTRRRTCSPGDYPDQLEVDGNELPLAYRFDPTDPDDGVTLEVPLPLLGVAAGAAPRVAGARLPAATSWSRVLRGLPKDLRRELVPIPDAAARLRAGPRRRSARARCSSGWRSW